MKKNIIITFIFIFLILPNNIKALDYCGYEDKARLQKIASNISTGYTYTETKDEESGYNSVKFTVTLSNLHDDILIVNENTKETYKNVPNNELVLNNIDAGAYLKFSVYGNIKNCVMEKITTIYVTLPIFNKYYTDDLCRSIPEYTLCNKWANVKMPYNQFKEKVQEHLNSLIVQPEVITVVKKETTFEKILNFLAKYNLLIFGSIIIICASLIYYLTRKDDFDLSLK